MRKWVNERYFWMFLNIRFSFLLGGPPWQSNFTRSSRSWLSEVRICHLYFRDLLIWSLKLAVFTHRLTPGMEVRDGRRLRQARPAAGIFLMFFLVDSLVDKLLYNCGLSPYNFQGPWLYWMFRTKNFSEGWFPLCALHQPLFPYRFNKSSEIKWNE